MAIDPRAKQEKYRQMQEERELLVNKALGAFEAREELRRAAVQGDKDYAGVIAETIRGGVSAADLKALGLDVPESLPKRKTRSDKKDRSAGAQEAPVASAGGPEG